MKILTSKKLLDTPIFSVSWDHAVDPGGFEIKRAIIRHSGSAVMMPVDERGRILLVRQYRLPAKQYLWELPAGRVDPGETVLKAAKRELREETGLRAKKWTKLASFFVSPGFLEENMTVFVAQDLTQGAQETMEDERIEMEWFPSRRLDDLIADSIIQDAKTIIGFLKWKRYGARIVGEKQSR